MDKDAEAIVGKAQQIADEVIAIMSGYALDLVGAILILFVGWTVAGWVRRLLRKRLLASPMVDDTIAPYVANVAYYVILIFVLVAVLNQFGVQTTSIIAALGAAGLAVGLALQGTLSNVAAGLMLLFLRPFKVGDFVDTASGSGTVEQIGLFTTTFTTFDGVFVSTPNSGIIGGAITNYSRNPTRRVDITIGIAYDDDIDKARAILQGLMDGDERVLPEPGSQTMVTALGDSAVDVNMRCWVNAGDYWSFLFDTRQKAKVEFDAAGLNIPFPQRDVHVIERKS